MEGIALNPDDLKRLLEAQAAQFRASMTESMAAEVAAVVGKLNAAKSSLPLSDLVSKYLEGISAVVKPRTLEAYRSRLHTVCTTELPCGRLGDMLVSDLRYEYLDIYRAVRSQMVGRKKTRIGSTAIGAEINDLKTAIKWASRRGRRLIHDNPIDGYYIRSDHPRRRTHYSEATVERIAEAASPRLRAVMFCILDCGLRPSETLSSSWPQVDEERRLLSLDGWQTKNSKPARVFIGGRAWDALQTIRAESTSQWLIPSPRFWDRPCSIDTIDTEWATIRSRLKISGTAGEVARLYDLRATGNRVLDEAGASLRVRKHWLRHSDYRSIPDYDRADEIEVAAAISALEKKRTKPDK